MMLQTVLPLAGGLFVLAMLLSALRLLRGPAVADRVLALDTLYINALSLLVLEGLAQRQRFNVEVVLLIGLLGFIGTVAMARYLARSDIVE